MRNTNDNGVNEYCLKMIQRAKRGFRENCMINYLSHAHIPA